MFIFTITFSFIRSWLIFLAYNTFIAHGEPFLIPIFILFLMILSWFQYLYCSWWSFFDSNIYIVPTEPFLIQIFILFLVNNFLIPIFILFLVNLSWFQYLYCSWWTFLDSNIYIVPDEPFLIPIFILVLMNLSCFQYLYCSW